MKIILGSTNNFKKEIVNRVSKSLDLRVEIISHEAESGISDQPIGISLTKRGAINRAKSSFDWGVASNLDAEIGLGLEVGYKKRKDGLFEMLCVAAIYDGHKKYFATSHEFLLPSFHQNILKNERYLGDHVREFLPQNNIKAANLVREMIINREPFLKTAAQNVLVLYLCRHDYIT